MKLRIKKLPLISIAVAMILAIGLVLFVGAYSKKGALSQINIWGARETIVDPKNKDTDNDGLKDWEEDLYKTDFTNPDTDGDGYLDGEEINSDHNPLVKGPGDKQAFYPLPVGDKYNITARVLSDEFMEALLRSYLTQKGKYLEDHPEIQSQDQFLALTKTSTIAEISERAIYENYPILLEQAGEILSDLPEIFDITVTDDQIKMSDDNSPEAINAYFTKISSIIKSEDFIFNSKNIQTLLYSFEDNSFSKLDKIILANDPKIGQLKEIIVPSSWKEIHKKVLGLTILTRNVFISLRGVESDFLKAQLAVSELEELPEKWERLMNQILELNTQ